MILDIILLCLLIYNLHLGYKQGFFDFQRMIIRTLLSIVTAYLLSGFVIHYLKNSANFLPPEILSSDYLFYIVTFLLFIITIFILNLVIRSPKREVTSLLDKTLGLIIGFVRFLLLVFLVVICYNYSNLNIDSIESQKKASIFFSLIENKRL